MCDLTPGIGWSVGNLPAGFQKRHSHWLPLGHRAEGCVEIKPQIPLAAETVRCP